MLIDAQQPHPMTVRAPMGLTRRMQLRDEVAKCQLVLAVYSCPNS